MIFQKLDLAGSLFSNLNTRDLRFGILFLCVLCQSASAQNSQPRPLPRLITDPVSEAAYSRSRTVTRAEPPGHGTDAHSVPLPSIDEATDIERRAFEKTNEARIQNGLDSLTWDPELYSMARAHSESMARLGYFSHETPDGLPLKERAHLQGILHFKVIGENIAYNKGYEDPGGFAVERWLTSSGHRANILYRGFQASAIGSYVSSDGSVYLTQVFITR